MFLIVPIFFYSQYLSRKKKVRFSVDVVFLTGTDRVSVTAFCVTVYPGYALIPSDLRFQYSATDQTSVYIKTTLWGINLISCGLIDIHGGVGAIMRN